MFVFKTVADLTRYLQAFRDKKRPVGFVPTMGALHLGHLSLVNRSLEETTCTVCSIFVNPTQFNEAGDLERYPRSPAQDLELLYQSGCDVVFMPEVSEVYPKGVKTSVDAGLDFGALATVMEGAQRPGHFDGVAQVVRRLLDIVEPTHMYMGEKDYQQLLIVRSMVSQLNLPVEVVGCPIVREPDGLAMSSRNQRLSETERQQALSISKTLAHAAEWVDALPPEKVEQQALEQLEAAGLAPEYFTLADAENLQPIQSFDEAKRVIAFVAARSGGVRLIDNQLVKS